MPRQRASIWAMVLLALVACAGPAQRRAPAEGVGPGLPTDARAPGAEAVAAPSFHPGARALGPPPEGAQWARATAGDPASLARLADEQGALGLLAGIELGGEVGRVGLGALPFASDHELALGGLCRLAARVDESSKELVLHAVLASASNIVPDAERLDPDGIHACLRVLATLRRDPAALARDLADAAFVAIRERTGFSWGGPG